MKRLFNFLVLLTLASSIDCFSQITTNELPISIQKKVVTNLSLNRSSMVSLPIPDMDRVLKEDQEREENNNSLKRISIGIPVSISMDEYGLWTTLDDGGKLWQLQISAENAKALDFVFNKFWLPDGSKFYIFNPLTLETIGAVTSEYLLGSKCTPHRFSTAMLKGDNMILEYYQPKDVKDLPIIEVIRAYYVYNPRITTSCSDEVNVNCSEGADWKKEKNAVARIDIKLQDSYWGTGALLNCTQANYMPLLLTANHCLLGKNDPEPKDALGDSDASDWVFYWNYELAYCDAPNTPSPKTTYGATIIANNPYSDFALLQLQQDPLSLWDYIPYYLGWDRSGNSGTGGVGIHHPEGDVKKISTYSMTPITMPFNSGPSVYWGVNWIATANGHGITEGGSSGSPLINSNHKVIGQLRGSNNSCSNLLGTSCYGKFDVSWTGNGNSNIHRRLDYWLNPLGNYTTLNGSYPFSINGPSIVCASATYSINHIKTGCSVTWSFQNNPSLNSLIQSNSPLYNQCTINNPSHQTINDTLVANIYQSSQLLSTVKKHIKAYNPFSATYSQIPEGNNKYGFPTIINSSIIDYEIYVNPACDITLNSQNFQYMTITSSNPSIVLNVQPASVGFYVPYNSGISHFTISGSSSGGCNDFSILVHVMTTPLHLLDVVTSGNEIQLALLSENEDLLSKNESLTVNTEQPVWNIEIINAQTGAVVYSGQQTDPQLNVDITGWTPGVYIIRVTIGEEIITKKISIK